MSTLSLGDSRIAPWPAQNWILNPALDALCIIGAPLIVLSLVLVAFAVLRPVAATVLVLGVHVVMTVAHHMPTFIRIYGDVELRSHFKWTLRLAPAIPLAFSLAIVGYIDYHGYPVELFLYVYLMLALWDPWHFLRQHYGFMRIYDRPNTAPRPLAARMDLILCATCFVFIMLASGEWLSGMLADLYTGARLPLLMAFSSRTIELLTWISGAAALAAMTAYGVYLCWCWRQRYFISAAKLALFIVTFSVMYLTYTPNAWIRGLAPGWSFPVGFAAIGIVHMTQYLAIVWRYNRGLAAKAERSRAGIFRSLHARGGWLAAAGYVALCLLYGDLITLKYDSRWLMSALLPIGFTSTLLHYYFDGFIWKLRHRQNGENLLSEAESARRGTRASSWSEMRVRSAPQVLLRHALYFGVPMGILTWGAVSAWNAQSSGYIEHMFRAQTLHSEGLESAAHGEARVAFGAMQREMPYARRLAELRPTAAREAELAFLIYNRARYEHDVLPAIDGKDVDADEMVAYLTAVQEAIRVLQHAIDLGGSLAHQGREAMTANDAARVLQSWRHVAAGLEAQAAVIQIPKERSR
jgi:hypothetical protein